MHELRLKVPEELERKIEKFKWVNWSRVLSDKVEELEELELERKAAKISGISEEDARKKEIFGRFIRDEMSAGDEEFCEKTGWDPLDEMEVREEYIEKLKRIGEGPHIPMTLRGLDKLLGLK